MTQVKFEEVMEFEIGSQKRRVLGDIDDIIEDLELLKKRVEGDMVLGQQTPIWKMGNLVADFSTLQAQIASLGNYKSWTKGSAIKEE